MEYRLWINGGWADSQDGGRMKIEDGARGGEIGEVVDWGRQDVDQAVRAAEAAFYDGRWSRKTPSERSRALLRMADLLESRSQEFARVESQNTGKPYEYVSLGADMPFLIDNLRFFAAA